MKERDMTEKHYEDQARRDRHALHYIKGWLGADGESQGNNKLHAAIVEYLDAPAGTVDFEVKL